MPQVLRVMRTLWAALVMSVLMLIGVAFMVPAPPSKVPPPPAQLYAITAVALVVAIVSFVLPAKNRATVLKNAPPWHPRDGLNGDAARQRFARVQTPFILSCALSESVALFGLVLHMLGYAAVMCAPFFAFGLVLMLLRFPTGGLILGGSTGNDDRRY